MSCDLSFILPPSQLSHTITPLCLPSYRPLIPFYITVTIGKSGSRQKTEEGRGTHVICIMRYFIHPLFFLFIPSLFIFPTCDCLDANETLRCPFLLSPIAGATPPQEKELTLAQEGVDTVTVEPRRKKHMGQEWWGGGHRWECKVTSCAGC